MPVRHIPTHYHASYEATSFTNYISAVISKSANHGLIVRQPAVGLVARTEDSRVRTPPACQV